MATIGTAVTLVKNGNKGNHTNNTNTGDVGNQANWVKKGRHSNSRNTRSFGNKSNHSNYITTVPLATKYLLIYVSWSFCKVFLLRPILTKIGKCLQILLKIYNIDIAVNLICGNLVVPSGQTDERMNMTQLIVALRKCFAKAPKNYGTLLPSNDVRPSYGKFYN